jgi:hypothetical protein
VRGRVEGVSAYEGVVEVKWSVSRLKESVRRLRSDIFFPVRFRPCFFRANKINMAPLLCDFFRFGKGVVDVKMHTASPKMAVASGSSRRHPRSSLRISRFHSEVYSSFQANTIHHTTLQPAKKSPQCSPAPSPNAPCASPQHQHPQPSAQPLLSSSDRKPHLLPASPPMSTSPQ